MNDMFALEGYYALYEITTVRRRNISEERISHLHEARSVKSRQVWGFFVFMEVIVALSGIFSMWCWRHCPLRQLDWRLGGI
jgi:hypothetical protein